MIRSMDFHFDAPEGLALAVALPLLLVCLFWLERRRLPAGSGESASESRRARPGTAIALAVSMVSALAGIVATFWVLVATRDDPFTNPVFVTGLSLLGLAVLTCAVAVAAGRRHRPVLQYSSTAVLKSVDAGKPSAIRLLAPALRALALAMLVLALARPQVATTEADVFAEGMDIVITLDVSTSMRAVDFAPPSGPRQHKSRIEGAKEVIASFIRQRQEDRLGLVVFAAEAFTQCPLTLDYAVVQGVLKSVRTGVIDDGTAIGNAIVVSVNRLRESEAKSKVIILLTDGDDNASKVAPEQAAEIAAEEGIHVFPILVGKGGLVPYPVGTNVFGQMQYRKVEIRTDPDLLKRIARVANGKFYRAVDQQALEEDFQDILDHMEKTRLMDPGRFSRNTEVFQLALLPALLMVLLELAMGWTRFRRFP